jgi:hypothetical protein
MLSGERLEGCCKEAFVMAVVRPGALPPRKSEELINLSGSVEMAAILLALIRLDRAECCDRCIEQLRMPP